jgi:LacI family transcriptional regulator
MLDITPDLNVNCIGIDNAQGMNLICSHLYDEGFRKFGFISADWRPWTFNRLNTVKKYCEHKTNLLFDNKWTNTPTPSENNWKRIEEDILELHIRQIMSEKPRPDVLVCGNDYTAVTAADILLSSGFNIPEDIGITGYGYSLSRHTYKIHNKLTTVREDYKMIARLAVNLLNDIIHEGSTSPKQPIVLQPELITGCTSIKKTYPKSDAKTLYLKNEIYSYILSI